MAGAINGALSAPIPLMSLTPSYVDYVRTLARYVLIILVTLLLATAPTTVFYTVLGPSTRSFDGKSIAKRGNTGNVIVDVKLGSLRCRLISPLTHRHYSGVVRC